MAGLKAPGRRLRAASFVLLTLVLAGRTPAAAEPGAGSPAAPEDGGRAVSVRYLGSGGLSIRAGGESLLTAPFFSNPGLWRVIFAPIAADPDRLPADLQSIVRDARGILVGHAHYDHLMDVPLVARLLPQEAVIYGSATTAHILAGAPDLGVAVENVEDLAGTPESPGSWIPAGAGKFRFMAVRSGHAPHWAGMRFYDGSYEKDLKRLPRFASRWVLGQPLSFVIDILDSAHGDPVFRIFYQDAATSPPQGFPPPLDDGKEFDLAVLCVASFSQVKDHPEAILRRLEPRAVMLIHWEDFFRPQSEPVRPVPGTSVDEFVRRLEAVLPEEVARHRPVPGETVTFPLP